MPETPVLEKSCPVCGTPDPQLAGGMCQPCVKALGSVVVIPESTQVGDSKPVKAPSQPPRFDDYEIISELARGGMGVVYVARQLSLNRNVALKMILTPFASDAQKRRFNAEAEHMATLEHPNIIPVYDCGEVEGTPYFTMKLIQGRSLNAELRRLFLEPRKAITILTAVAKAVHFAHQRGILHRDLKPHNILIDNDGVPYVGDFGIAKRVESPNGDLTQTGFAVGTPQYMSPEQASGNASKITTASDVYSIGAILYEMLTLRLPFVAPTTWEILQKVRTEDPTPPRKLRPTVNRDLETICLKCLEKDPARRYGSAQALALDLERWLNGVPIHARPHSLVERGVKWARKNPALTGSAALIAVCVLAVAGFYWRSNMLVFEAEQRRVAERLRAAAVAIADGKHSLQTARLAAAKNRTPELEQSLIDAEDRFRVALYNVPGNKDAEFGLCETALTSFEVALTSRNWRQAHEKLLLAKGAALPFTQYESRRLTLERLESERGNHIRARVKTLMDDAASLTRRVTHEMAVYELIAMKDDVTVELLKPYVNHAHPECRTLACAALAWIGDASLVSLLRAQTIPITPDGKENPVSVQVAALTAVCMLAADEDQDSYQAVRARIFADTGDKSTLLYHRIKLHFDEFAKRQAKSISTNLDESPSALLLRAQRAQDSNELQEALGIYNQLIEKDPTNIEFINQRGLVLHELKENEAALKAFDEVVTRLPNEKMGFVNRANVRMDIQDNSGALSDINKAIELAPGDNGLLSTRGLILQQSGDMKSALADFSRALEFNPEDIYALTNRGSARAAQRDFVGAMADYDRALALSPNFRQALTSRACARMELRDFDGSLADFDKTLALDPTQVHCYINRAVIRTQKQDIKGAISEYDRCIEISPTNARAYYNRGVLRTKLGENEAAARDYEQAIKFDPSRAEPVVNLGLIRETLGDSKGALKLFDQALAINPKKIEAWLSRANLHEKKQAFDLAAADFKKVLEILPAEAPQEMRDEIIERVKSIESLKKK